MAKFSRCNMCGAVVEGLSTCAECGEVVKAPVTTGRTLGRLGALAAIGGSAAISITMMACYGAPPRPEGPPPETGGGKPPPASSSADSDAGATK